MGFAGYYIAWWILGVILYAMLVFPPLAYIEKTWRVFRENKDFHCILLYWWAAGGLLLWLPFYLKGM